jgi:hypothetical protein
MFITAIRCNGTLCGGDGAIFDSRDDPPVPTAYCLSSNYPLISYSLPFAHQRCDTDVTHVDSNVTRCGLLPMRVPNLKADAISFQPIPAVPPPLVTVPSIPTFANPTIPTFSVPSSLSSGSSAHDDKTTKYALTGASIFITALMAFVTWMASRKKKKDAAKDKLISPQNLPPGGQSSPIDPRTSASESTMRPLATSVPLRAPHAEIVEIQEVERPRNVEMPRDLEQAQEVERPRQVKRRRLHWPLLTIPYFILAGILYNISAIPLLLIIRFLASPYTLFYYAPNWGMLDKEISPVQLYLDHFEVLYPNLISFIASVSNSTISTGRHAQSVEFWPFKLTEQPFTIPGPTGLITGSKGYAFSKAAELFGRLEDAGWSRRVLYTFLRDKVEQSEYELSAQEKEAFAAVMQKMCNHCFIPWLTNAYHWIFDLSTQWMYRRVKGWDIHLPSEMRIVYVDMNSVEWILERGNAHLPGVLLVPRSPKALSSMERLVQGLPMWGKVEMLEDFNTDFRHRWQVMVNNHQGL